MQSTMKRNYKNNLLQQFLFYVATMQTCSIPDISLLRRNACSVLCGRLFCVGLLVNYLLIGGMA